jgi:hypothetical protein
MKVQTMKITMIRGKLGSNDGATTKFYEEGETYEVSEALGQCFLEEKVAEEVSEESVSGKAVSATPKNKAVAAAPENKAQ